MKLIKLSIFDSNRSPQRYCKPYSISEITELAGYDQRLMQQLPMERGIRNSGHSTFDFIPLVKHLQFANSPLSIRSFQSQSEGMIALLIKSQLAL